MQLDNTTAVWQERKAAKSQSAGQSTAMIRRLATFFGMATFGAACAAIAIYASPGQATRKATTPTANVALPEPVTSHDAGHTSQKWDRSGAGPRRAARRARSASAPHPRARDGSRRRHNDRVFEEARC